MNKAHKVDRTGWGSGPWDNEPDKIQWRTASGLHALIVRNEIGALCGYVGLPPGHAAIENQDELLVHGGITYNRKCSGAICHLPESDETDDVMWLGFDCCHVGDFWPFRSVISPDITHGGTYRDVAYVRAQCESLADQCTALESASSVPSKSPDATPSEGRTDNECP